MHQWYSLHLLNEFVSLQAYFQMHVLVVGYDKLSVTGYNDELATAEHDKAIG